MQSHHSIRKQVCIFVAFFPIENLTTTTYPVSSICQRMHHVVAFSKYRRHSTKTNIVPCQTMLCACQTSVQKRIRPSSTLSLFYNASITIFPTSSISKDFKSVNGRFMPTNSNTGVSSFPSTRTMKFPLPGLSLFI